MGRARIFRDWLFVEDALCPLFAISGLPRSQKTTADAALSAYPWPTFPVLGQRDALPSTAMLPRSAVHLPFATSPGFLDLVLLVALIPREQDSG
jgi:hypothetical protein